MVWLCVPNNIMGKSLARRVHKSILSYASNKFYFGIFNSLLLNWILVFYSGKQTVLRARASSKRD